MRVEGRRPPHRAAIARTAVINGGLSKGRAPARAPLRILYHHRIRSKDGQFVHLEEMVNALRGAGHEVVVCGPKAVEKEQFGTSGRLIPWLKQHLPQALYEIIEVGYSIAAYRRLAHQVRKHKPDIIYERYNLHLLSGIWVKKRFGVPLLLEVNAPLFEERSKHDGLSFKSLARWAERFCWTNADVVLPVTDVLAKHVARTGVPQTRIRVVPNAINLERFQCVPAVNEAKRRIGFGEGLTIGFVGFVRQWHGINHVVDLLSQPAFSKVSLIIVGDGPARAAIEREAQQRGVSSRVMITGIVPREKVAEYIAAFDVALQPDVVPYASPLKIYEYMAMGKPIVAPSRPNIREVLRDEHTGLLFDPDDADAFRASLERLLADESLRHCLGDNALEHIASSDISWAHNADTVGALGWECVDKTHASGGH